MTRLSSVICIVVVIVALLVVVQKLVERPRVQTENYYYYDQPRGRGCFVPEALVAMADGSQKRLDEVRAGEWVRSGRTGEPVMVLFVHVTEVSDFHLIGFDDWAPFATSSHTFLGVDKPRVCVDVEQAVMDKKWNPNDMGVMEEGCRVYQLTDLSLTPYSIRRIHHHCLDGSILYDIFTTDHSFIVNGFAVHDDFPEIERHPQVALRILHILTELMQTHTTVVSEEQIDRAREVPVSDAIDDEQMQLSLELLTHPELQQVADTLWIDHFDELST